MQDLALHAGEDQEATYLLPVVFVQIARRPCAGTGPGTDERVDSTETNSSATGTGKLTYGSNTGVGRRLSGHPGEEFTCVLATPARARRRDRRERGRAVTGWRWGADSGLLWSWHPAFRLVDGHRFGHDNALYRTWGRAYGMNRVHHSTSTCLERCGHPPVVCTYKQQKRSVHVDRTHVVYRVNPAFGIQRPQHGNLEVKWSKSPPTPRQKNYSESHALNGQRS